MEKSNAVLIQQASGDYRDLLDLTQYHHLSQCNRQGIEYKPIYGPYETEGRHPYWAKVAAIRDAVKAGYEYIFWLDADCLIVGDTNLRNAAPSDGLWLTYHAQNWGDLKDICYDHFNCGAIYVKNGPEAREFIDRWWNTSDENHPWADQHALNKLANSWYGPPPVRKIGHEWNSTEDTPFQSSSPIVRAWHGYGYAPDRLVAMKAVLEGKPAPERPVQEDRLIDIEDAFVEGWQRCLQHDPEGEKILSAVLDANPTHQGALRQLGMAYAERGEEEYGEALLRQAISYNPLDPLAWNGLGAALSGQGRHEEAVAALNEALRLAPDMPSARWNRATPNLSLGDLVHGWEDYQYGKLCGLRPWRFLEPEMNHQEYTGTTVYLWGEQGIGDTIMCAGLVEKFRNEYGFKKVIMEVRPELVCILQGVPGIDQVVAYHDAQHKQVPFDVHCSLMSIPYWLICRNCGDQGYAKPYIQSPAAQIEADGLKVGLCWHGSKHHPNDAKRSIPTGEVKPLVNVRGVTWVSLQQGDALPFDGVNPELTNWYRTAQVIAACDVIVTVDTAVAHLAGAMGKPTWTLLPKIPDFRWRLRGETTRWYPSMRLFRQYNAGDWASVLSEVAVLLEDRNGKEGNVEIRSGEGSQERCGHGQEGEELRQDCSESGQGVRLVRSR